LTGSRAVHVEPFQSPGGSHCAGAKDSHIPLKVGLQLGNKVREEGRSGFHEALQVLCNARAPK
jgi:hypothetical protein